MSSEEESAVCKELINTYSKLVEKLDARNSELEKIIRNLESQLFHIKNLHLIETIEINKRNPQKQWISYFLGKRRKLSGCYFA